MAAPKNLTGQIREVPGGSIDSGGFSAVRLAHWQPLHLRRATTVHVAVKTLKVSGNVSRDAAQDKLNKRLHREARIWMKLSHPCIAPFIGFVVEDQGPGLVSLWYHRGNLLRFLSRQYYTTVNREILCHDVAAGLHYLHTHDPPIIHGDLKGANVLVDPGGRACLCDFGLSIMTDGLPSGHTSSDFGGSLRFLAPELLESSAKSAATDVYAFGCLCLEALLGTEPYSECTPESKIMRLIADGIPPFTFGDDIERFMIIPKHLVIQCWTTNPRARPTSGHLVSGIRNALLERHRVAVSLRDTLGNSECTLTALDGSSYRARLSNVTKDNRAATFSTIAEEGPVHQIRIDLYRRVEWWWDIEKDISLTAFSPSTSLTFGLLTELRASSLTSTISSLQPNVPIIKVGTSSAQDLDEDIEWNFVEPLFRPAAQTIPGEIDQPSSWQEYVERVTQKGSSNAQTTTEISMTGSHFRSNSKNLRVPGSHKKNTHRKAKSLSLTAASFLRSLPWSTDGDQDTFGEYTLPDTFGDKSDKQLESGPQMVSSLPVGQARSPTFSRVVGFDDDDD